MATRIIEQITDDLDGSDGAETVTFGFAGKFFEIDLSPGNKQKLEKALAPFVEKARRSGHAPRGPRTSGSQRSYDPAAVRAWARSAGVNVPTRGRIPASVVQQFHAAGH